MFLLSLTENEDISGLKAKGILEYFYNFTFDDGYSVSALQSYSGNESEAKKVEFTTSVAEQRKNLLNISPNPVKPELCIRKSIPVRNYFKISHLI